MPGNRPRACRCLFGRPDPGDVDKFLQEADETYQREAERRWNFDFRAGRPLTDVNSQQRYEWVRVDNWKTVPSKHDNASQTLKQ